MAAFISIILLLLSLNHLALGYMGTMTWNPPGSNSCNIDPDTVPDHVALSPSVMGNGANPNQNPKCGSIIHIWDPATEETHSATVVDTCMGCAPGHIDVSPKLFAKIAPLSSGKVPVAWGGEKLGG